MGNSLVEKVGFPMRMDLYFSSLGYLQEGDINWGSKEVEWAYLLDLLTCCSSVACTKLLSHTLRTQLSLHWCLLFSYAYWLLKQYRICTRQTVTTTSWYFLASSCPNTLCSGVWIKQHTSLVHLLTCSSSSMLYNMTTFFNHILPKALYFGLCAQ